MNKFILRAGGLSPFITYLCLFSLVLIALLGNLSDWYKYHTVNWVPICVMGSIMLFLFLIFTWWFSIIRVEINGDELHVNGVQRYVQKDFLSGSFLGMENYKVSVRMKEIESVYIGELGKIEDIISVVNSERVNEFLGYHHDTVISPGSNPLIRMPRWAIAKYMPIVFIKTKNSKDSFIFSAKPFSRRGIMKFIQIIRLNGIEVTTQKYLNLEPRE